MEQPTENAQTGTNDNNNNANDNSPIPDTIAIDDHEETSNSPKVPPVVLQDPPEWSPPGGVELLECPICYELYNGATETFCGHAFCEYCINKWLEKDCVCPVCRRHALPVHPSFTLRRIVEEYRKIKGLLREQIQPRTSEEEKAEGNQCYQKGEFAEAIKHYSDALELHPSAILYGNRAAAYFKLKQYQTAIIDCDNALHMDDKYVKVYIRKAQCFEQLRDYDEAYKWFKQAKTLDKKDQFRDDIDQGMQRIQRFVTNFNPQFTPHQNRPPPQFYQQQFPFQPQPGVHMGTPYFPPPQGQYPGQQYQYQNQNQYQFNNSNRSSATATANSASSNSSSSSNTRNRNRRHTDDSCLIQ